MVEYKTIRESLISLLLFVITPPAMKYPMRQTVETDWQPSRAEVLIESNRINFGRVRIFSAILLIFHCFLLFRDIT
ncbi:MAG: hypothetical protein ACKO96_07715, partial [Flammeovirgaceae bacterium]